MKITTIDLFKTTEATPDCMIAPGNYPFRVNFEGSDDTILGNLDPEEVLCGADGSHLIKDIEDLVSFIEGELLHTIPATYEQSEEDAKSLALLLIDSVTVNRELG